MIGSFFLGIVICMITAESSALIAGSRRSDDTCGVPEVRLGLIIRGQKFRRGSYPWIVALMQTKASSGSPNFFCAGTLISRNFVISAAHCFLEKHGTEEMKARNVLAIFGAHDLSDPYEPSRYSLSPKRIHIHNEWNHRTREYDADLSLLEFEVGSILFNFFVQPICIWESESEPAITEGTVTGWGKSEDPANIHENIPKLIKVQIQHNDKCLPRNGDLADISSERTFCGLGNSSGVCEGDSGGGLFIETNGVNFLKGIVSSSLLKNDTCDVASNAIYTDVPKFMDWIKKITKGGLIASTPVGKVPKLLQHIADHRNIGLINKKCGVLHELRIIGGNQVRAGEYPWMALLMNYDQDKENREKWIGAGSLISESYVLTGASGFKNYLVEFVRLGEHDLSTDFDWRKDGKEPFTVQDIEIERTIAHPQYDNEKKLNNIGLILLKSPANLQKPNIGTICLPVEEGNQFEVLNEYDEKLKDKLIIAGWGQTESGERSNVLLRTKVSYISKETCAEELMGAEIHDSYLCTKGKSEIKQQSCIGDGGGPLFAPAEVENKVKMTQYGIMSFGVGCAMSAVRFPEISMNVQHYMNWILDNMDNANQASGADLHSRRAPEKAPNSARGSDTQGSSNIHFPE